MSDLYPVKPEFAARARISGNGRAEAAAPISCALTWRMRARISGGDAGVLDIKASG